MQRAFSIVVFAACISSNPVNAGCPFGFDRQDNAGVVESSDARHLSSEVDSSGLSISSAFTPTNPDTTEQGCTCTDFCYARISHDLAKRDWCWTARGCGRKSITNLGRSWDYCDYMKLNSFDERHDYLTKHNLLWATILEKKSEERQNMFSDAVLYFLE